MLALMRMWWMRGNCVDNRVFVVVVADAVKLFVVL
jgi:hypothetical protein